MTNPEATLSAELITLRVVLPPAASPQKGPLAYWSNGLRATTPHLHF
jgi:hypothetical protein